MPSVRREVTRADGSECLRKALLMSGDEWTLNRSRLFYSFSVTSLHIHSSPSARDLRSRRRECVFLYFSAAHCTVPHTVALCCHGDFLFHSSIKVISSVVAALSPVKNGHLIVFGESSSRGASGERRKKKINSISFRRSSSWVDSIRADLW